jgi:hypothetical protein
MKPSWADVPITNCSKPECEPLTWTTSFPMFQAQPDLIERP